MKKRLQRFIVDALEHLCNLADRLPFDIGARTHIGCPTGLAAWSSSLDEKWGTGVWGKVEDIPKADPPMTDEEWEAYSAWLDFENDQ